ncbi:hypothetical protein cypCar_00006716 [Cyprinus carpio]|nr:hypothetical protein cypCar_00006716 [Cyprinus carpio]
MFRLNNCIGFSNYKFFMLFLLYSLLYCLLIVTTVTPTFIQLWLGKLFDSCVKLHVLFLTLVSGMFAVTLCFLLFFHIWLLTSNKTTLGKNLHFTYSHIFQGDGHSFPLRWQMSSHSHSVMNGNGHYAMEGSVVSPEGVSVTVALDD